jgi:hypothetical protein
LAAAPRKRRPPRAAQPVAYIDISKKKLPRVVSPLVVCMRAGLSSEGHSVGFSGPGPPVPWNP